jgi:protein SCO1/2
VGGRQGRIGAAAAGLVLVAGALVAAAFLGGGSAPVELSGSAVQGKTPAPTFRLTDQDGRAVALSGGRGVTLVTFLYVHCPDVCPLIASRLDAALPQLGKGARVLAVSVDPKGDTPSAVRAYVRARHLRPAFHYLRGTRAQLAPVWKAFYVGQQDAPGTVLHTALTVLVDKEGRERVRYDASATPAQIAHDVRALGL